MLQEFFGRIGPVLEDSWCHLCYLKSWSFAEALNVLKIFDAISAEKIGKTVLKLREAI